MIGSYTILPLHQRLYLDYYKYKGIAMTGADPHISSYIGL
jgi:hypothetical protein